jgi:hypothetical protein
METKGLIFEFRHQYCRSIPESQPVRSSRIAGRERRLHPMVFTRGDDLALIITNAVLGAGVLGILVVVAIAGIREVMSHHRNHSPLSLVEGKHGGWSPSAKVRGA